jgi:hypothetical protein
MGFPSSPNFLLLLPQRWHKIRGDYVVYYYVPRQHCAPQNRPTFICRSIWRIYRTAFVKISSSTPVAGTAHTIHPVVGKKNGVVSEVDYAIQI